MDNWQATQKSHPHILKLGQPITMGTFLANIKDVTITDFSAFAT